MRKKFVKTISIVFCVVLILFGLVFILLLLRGYRPIQAEDTVLEWSAFGSLAEWVAGIAAIAIPVALFFIDKGIKDRDAKLLKDLSDFKNEYEKKLESLATLVTPEGKVSIDADTTEVKNVTAKWG